MSLPDIREQLSDLKGVLSVARELGATTDLRAVLSHIERAARSVMDCERASVFLYYAGTDELCTYVATGVEGLRIPASRGICGEALRTRRPINVPDAYADPRFNPQVDVQTGYRTRNLLTLPLMGVDDRVVGVLQMLNSLRGGFGEWDEQLAVTLAAQAGAAIQREMLLEQYAAKQKLENDLAIARSIQQQLLPEGPPEVDGFDIAGWNKPADQTGGDIYDFMHLEDGRLAVIIADATGHGIGPALVIAECRALLRATTCFTDDTNRIMTLVNKLLFEDLAADRFVTCFFGLLDPRNRTLRYCSAGHGPLLFFRSSNEEIVEYSATGMPLGIVGEMDFASVEPIIFQPGDMMVLVTDGFFEWLGLNSEQFGMDRLIETINRNKSRPSVELIEALYQSVLEYGVGTSQQDDLTAVVLKATR
jgi:phosphoserine phosphatase RsbU/P